MPKLCVDKELLKDASVSLTARMVYAQLLDHRNSATGQCNPRRMLLATELGLTEDQVKKALVNLRKAGWITTKKTQYTNSYTLERRQPGRNAPTEPGQIAPAEPVQPGQNTPTVGSKHTGSSLFSEPIQLNLVQRRRAAAAARGVIGGNGEQQPQHDDKKKFTAGWEPVYDLIYDLDKDADTPEIEAFIAACRKARAAITPDDLVALIRNYPLSSAQSAFRVLRNRIPPMLRDDGRWAAFERNPKPVRFEQGRKEGFTYTIVGGMRD